MLANTSLAPGKVILFGEHAVVYGRPAIAAPLTQLLAEVSISPVAGDAPKEILIDAPDIGTHSRLQDLPNSHPLAITTILVLKHLGVDQYPAFKISIRSAIPVASGLGSGAAVSVALIRGIAAAFERPLTDEKVSSLAFEVEKIYHGNPSGIDNTVVTYEKPVYFIRGRSPEVLSPKVGLNLIIGDTGVSSPTAQAVAGVRARWEAEPGSYERRFDRIGDITRLARLAIERGETEHLGPLLDENHTLLQEMEVSSPELDRLVEAARRAGAWGAKLSGGGAGGNMIALVPIERQAQIAQALREAGAMRIFFSEIQPN